MPAARDIMRRFPRRPEAAGAATEVRAFRETFGTSLLVVQKVWCLLVQEGVLPHKGLPKHRPHHFPPPPGTAADGLRMPGEFEPHRGCWMLWPRRPDNWRRAAQPAQPGRDWNG